MIDKKSLLEKYRISEDYFTAADIEWEDLEYIYNDFSKKIAKYEEISKDFQQEHLSKLSEAGIHSIRSRVKDPEHLVVKVIRKRQVNTRKYQKLSKDNYEKFFTDLIGIRCLVLFKSDWKKFHRYMVQKIEDKPEQYIEDNLEDFDERFEHTYMAERPKVHVRAGDSTEIYEELLHPDAIKSKKNYRSAHYIIKYHGVYIEIQVRTLFEEGWSEIDHCMVYPYYQNDTLLQQYTGLINRLAGLADEMGTFFCEVKRLEIEHLAASESTKVPLQKSEILENISSVVCPNTDMEVMKTERTGADCIKSVLDE